MRKETEIWPNFFIVGAPKAGTSSMYGYLKQSPDIFMSKVKEPCYFLSQTVQNLPRLKGRAITKKEDYLRLFKGAINHKAIGEASPFYLWDPHSPLKIHDEVPSAKIIIILRNPVHRAFSYYMMMLREGYESQPFFEALNRDYLQKINKNNKTYLYVEAGLYYSQVMRYISTFGLPNVKVLFFEEFTKNIVSSVCDVLSFLGLSPEVPKDFDSSAHNSHAFSIARPLTGTVIDMIGNNNVLFKVSQLVPMGLKSMLMNSVLTKKAIQPEIDDECKIMLREIYIEDIRKLESALDRKTPWDIS